MKKIALTLFAALCIASMLFVTACKDEDEDKCTEEAATECVDDAMECAMAAGADANACTQDFCGCLKDIGCPIEDYDSTGVCE